MDVGQRAWEWAFTLAEDLSPRASATDEELRAANYLSDTLEGWGYEVELQPFEAFEIWGATWLLVKAPELGFWQESVAFPVDPSTRRAEEYEVEGDLVHAGVGAQSDFSGLDVTGKVALMGGGGGVTALDKARNAAKAGAVAAVIFNEDADGSRLWTRIYEETPIPVVYVESGEGQWLAETLDEGSELVAQVLKAPTTLYPSRNVVAELDNDIGDDGVLFLGAHYDTTPDTQGANDNGAGLGVLLAVAEELSDDDLPFDLTIVLFGAEEIGLHGSFYYVGELEQSEIERALAMINVDSPGAGNLTIEGDERLVGLAIETAESLDTTLGVWSLPEGAASDHVAFRLAGIESLFLFADDLSRLNSPADTLDHLEQEPVTQAAMLVLELVATLAGE